MKTPIRGQSPVANSRRSVAPSEAQTVQTNSQQTPADATVGTASADKDAFDPLVQQENHRPSVAMGGGASVVHGSLMTVQPNAASIEKTLGHLESGNIKTADLVQRHPKTENNKIELLVGGKEAFPEIFKEIDGAKESLNVCYYIFQERSHGQHVRRQTHRRGKARCRREHLGGRHWLHASAARSPRHF